MYVVVVIFIVCPYFIFSFKILKLVFDNNFKCSSQELISLLVADGTNIKLK